MIYVFLNNLLLLLDKFDQCLLLGCYVYKLNRNDVLPTVGTSYNADVSISNPFSIEK